MTPSIARCPTPFHAKNAHKRDFADFSQLVWNVRL